MGFTWRVAAIVAFFTILPAFVSGFNPSWYTDIGKPLTNQDPITEDGGISAWGRPHEAMTKRGISTRYKPYFGIDNATHNMDTARQEIIEGSKIVDDHDD